MTDTPTRALKALRESLRTPIADVESLVECLEACLDDIGLASSTSAELDLDQTRRAVQRYLPSIQICLVSEVYPTFYHALDQDQLRLVERFFVENQSSDPRKLKLSRSIALTSYLTIPSFLNASHTPPLPGPSHSFVLDILSRLRESYNIDELYWAVWASDSGSVEQGAGQGRTKSKNGPSELIWEEVVKGLAGVPAKCANAVGRWKTEGWTGDLPAGLEAKPFFDHMVIRVERLMYELSMGEISQEESERIRIVIQRISSLGLLSPTTLQNSRQPSFIPPLLPGLLSHLHPPHRSSLPPYPRTYLPSLFLPLPASTLANLIENLLRNLPSRTANEELASLEVGSPSEMVLRSVRVLEGIIGPAVLKEEAWVAVLRCVSGRSNFGTPLGTEEHLRNRMIVSWVRTGGEAACKAFLDHVVGLWTNPSSIKFSMYTQQFHLTHLLLLSFSLLRPYHPYLIANSHRGEFLIAVQSFLSHPDPKIRRLGMLVAEILSGLTIKEDPAASAGRSSKGDEDEIEELKAGLDAEEGGAKTARAPRRLQFGSGMWEGDGEGKEECRWLRGCVGVDDLAAELLEDSTGQAWMFGWTLDTSATHYQETTRVSSGQGDGTSRGRPTRDIKTKRTTKAKTKTNAKPGPKIVLLDSDQEADPLQSYAPSSPSSSRSPSPTPSYLEEVAQDPTLALDTSQKKKITRPVYVQQLIALLKEREKPERIEMGLKWGEGLVRAKRSFGTELSENATNVALVTLALSDPYHLDDFDEKRQGLLNALVACAPKQVAPFLSEQYFNGQYSLQQKSVLLTSLAMGARELAGLSIPEAQAPKGRRIDFPSKTLPPALHQKYIGPNDIPPNSNKAFMGQLEDAIGGVRDLMLSKGAKRGEETVPELAREKRLRVGGERSTKVAELGSAADRQMTLASGSRTTQTQIPVVPYKDVAAEYFIMPLINRFWQHFQDSSIRESRAISSGDRYRGAGTGMVLSAMALEKMLMTLSLLLHAARHSAAFLSVLAPEALELGVTIGARHLATPANDPFLADSDVNKDEGSKTEAQVLAAALELVLVSLDTSVELDKGRTLAMDKPELILAVGEWATGVFEIENRGGQVSAGQGGMREGRVRATAAGVVVKVAEIGERWVTIGRMMR